MTSFKTLIAAALVAASSTVAFAETGDFADKALNFAIQRQVTVIEGRNSSVAPAPVRFEGRNSNVFVPAYGAAVNDPAGNSNR